MKRNSIFIGLAAIVAVLSLLAATGFGFGEGAGLTADGALKKLVEGNARFAGNDPTQKDLGSARRTELTKGQHPLAVIVSCSDSRVPPEHVFDQGLGDLFVVRTAGNVVGSVDLGSVEYAVEHLKVPLVLVLGHQSCGAVKAAMEGGKPEGHIGLVVKKIQPAVKKAEKESKDERAVLNTAIRLNVINTAAALRRESPLIKHLADEKKVKIAGGVYSLETGQVEFFDVSTAAAQ